MNFSDSEREESEYETDGGEDERSPERRMEDSEPEWQDSEDEEQEAEAPEGGASEEEIEVRESCYFQTFASADCLLNYDMMLC